MSELDETTARWLVADGREAVDAVTAALDAGEDELRVLERLRGSGLDAARTAAVLGAAGARRRARGRWPDAERLLFTREALEQASDPQVSDWRTRRLAGRVVWDLCAGCGGDTLAAARHGAAVTAVDRDAGRLVLLAHNAAVTGVEVELRRADVLDVDVPAGALVHVDPGRRREGRRVRRLAEHLPPVGAVWAAHGRDRGIAVVLSPAVALDDPDLPTAAELEFVQVGDDLREAVAWGHELRSPGVRARATLLPEGHTRVRTGGARSRRPVGPPGAFLVEVAPAAVRARLHDQIGAEIGAHRLADGRALLTSDELPPASPWYRVRPVHAVLPVRPKVVRRWLREADPDVVELVAHGLPLDVGAWWRALGRPPRGPAGWRIELVRTDDGGRVLVTRAAAGSAARTVG
ncbi:class I SAM-dependent methyltransferase [Egicoccus halophilus]|uniref:THUMP-like domain-containing protein n=1 Tax=Egicoccus halophilus TaxID=1670830 RepID=A0A8J3EX03_9ACTN|nr:class I SAM-dependent methyltransferase [Egicoccus halophilus]GGI04783.1 hypothetical protein GCM10011354_10820 [Egicoccus halophilus]